MTRKLRLLNLAPLYKCFIFRESNVIINVAYLIIVVKSIFYCQNEFSTFPTVMTRVSVQGVESLGGHFATLCREFDFDEVKKIYYYFSKRKGKYFYIFNHFYSQKSSKKSKIAQIYYYDPQSAGINLKSPQLLDSNSRRNHMKISTFSTFKNSFRGNYSRKYGTSN